ncbi:shikimate dehydrogenase family protein [Anditalea andensis]|uniref:Shikimate dehydrogenase n=1 Tax=Anditalea andensis TaxID=1048983 RepID=A0A074LED4_9BACT|nr:shikimate dehydrogenase [Anditalea andensis]KEO72117.1 shikimate dehydrogenase [Anditalea andensis]
MRKFGLIGFPLTHSFSKRYFEEKFRNEDITDAAFHLYEMDAIAQFPELINDHPALRGLSVTIPYKEKIIPYLDEMDPACQAIGAVNCIKIGEGKLKGYNTDYIGFYESLKGWLGIDRPNALILGTGGASKAVAQALKNLNINYRFVSRNRGTDQNIISYDNLVRHPDILMDHTLIINTTPIGTFPSIDTMPDIPLDAITAKHKVYDLVYNPEKTFLMRSFEARGALSKNGLEMLHLQAEAAWKIWNQ